MQSVFRSSSSPSVFQCFLIRIPLFFPHFSTPPVLPQGSLPFCSPCLPPSLSLSVKYVETLKSWKNKNHKKPLFPFMPSKETCRNLALLERKHGLPAPANMLKAAAFDQVCLEQDSCRMGDKRVR